MANLLQNALAQRKAQRNLRKARRQAKARRRTEQSERIMASTGTDKEFYRLVTHQSKIQNSTLPFMTVDNKMMDTPEDICGGWATYFQGLATPSNNENYDDVTMRFFYQDIDHIINFCSKMNQTIPPATLSEVRYAISRLKSNKAADYLDLTSEHFKYGGLCIETYLLNLVN